MFYPITEHTLKTDLFTSGYLQCGKQTEPLIIKKGISMFCFKFISFLSAHRRAAPVLALWLLTSALLVACASKPLPQVATVVADQTQVAASLHKLFESSWEDGNLRYPEWATWRGDDRYGDRLNNRSPTQQAANRARVRQELAQAREIDRGALNSKDKVSLDMFVEMRETNLSFEPMVGYRRMTLGALGGFQTSFAQLLKASPTRTVAQAEQILARMAAYPTRVSQELVNLREGQALGWVPPRSVINRVLAMLDSQLAAVGDKSPFYEPFTRLGSGIPAIEQAVLRDKALRAIAQHVLPAQRQLREFVAGPYAADAPESGNLGRYPGGAAAYAASVLARTTTDLTPAQIHTIGLREVARLRGDIEQVMREMDWKGDFASFAQHMSTDPKYLHPNGEALMAAYRDIGKRIDAELPKLFAELPRATYGVRAMPDALGPDAAETYNRPLPDGRGPGWFNANALGYKTRPKWSQESLTAHEAVPGHHLQMARAIELGDLPRFRRLAGNVAYIEGWATYAETLGFQLGLYRDAASRFGHYQAQIWRAARLVVDTGLHDQDWSRQRAVDYMVEVTGQDRAFMESEVDRYLSDPGQALGYMIGQLKIIELRERARLALGARFDIRRFHMAVLDQGAVPLTVLERQIADWISVESVARR